MQCTRPAFRHVLRCSRTIPLHRRRCRFAVPEGVCRRRDVYYCRADQLQWWHHHDKEALLVCDGDRIQVTLRTSFRARDQRTWGGSYLSRTGRSTWRRRTPISSRAPGRVDGTAILRETNGRSSTSAVGGAGGTSEPVGRVVVAETGRAGMFDYAVSDGDGDRRPDEVACERTTTAFPMRRGRSSRITSIAAGAGWRFG